MTANLAPLLAMLSLNNLRRLCRQIGDDLDDEPRNTYIDDWKDGHHDHPDE